MKAPAPDTLLEVNVTVTGPLPLLLVSAVQIRLSAELNPLRPIRFQLQGVDGQTTETRLLGPCIPTDPLIPPVEVKLGLAVSAVASAPSCDHAIVSLAPRAP